MKTAGRRRGFKSWFVEPYRQVKLGLMFLVINILFAGIICGVFGYYVWDVYQAVTLYFKLTQGQEAQILDKFATPIWVGIGIIAVFVFSTILISVRYTYQIYGPLVSIHRYLDELLGGRTASPLQLRESDQLKDLATKLNSVAERLGDQRQAPLVPIHKFLDELLEGGNPEPLHLRESDGFQELTGKLNVLAERLKASEGADATRRRLS